MTLSTAALSQDDAPRLIAVLQRAQDRIHQLEQENSALQHEIRWIDRLLAVPASIMSPSQKVTLRAAVKAYQQATPDENGLVQIQSWKLCKTVGQSRQTFLDNLTYCTEQLGILTKKRERLVDSDTNDYTTNLFIGVTPRLSHPQQYRVEKPRNHGGERQRCPHCHSDRLQRKVTMTCMHCGSVLDEKISLVNQASQLDESQKRQDRFQAENGQVEDDQEPAPDTNVNLTSSITTVLERQRDDSALPEQEPATPPVGEAVNGVGHTDTQGQVASLDAFSEVKARYASHDEQRQGQPHLSLPATLNQAEVRAHAAKLLVEIAGPEPVHIEMSPRGPKKYYDVHRGITVQDTHAHLGGWKTKGASLRYPDGMTRALCYDADTPQDWQTLQTAARFLTYGDFCPLLEPSPVPDDEHTGGGHLWIIFTDLVKASWAHQHALQYAPMLHEIKESWPSPRSHQIRLPGGKYVKPGIARWCSLSDAHGRLLATDGPSAARVLLDAQTPAEMIPAYPEPEDVGHYPGLEPSLNADQQAHSCREKHGTACQEMKRDEMQAGVDQHWQHTYSHHLWFHFTPAQLAAWYNERQKVEDLLPLEQNGMGLASWRGERTASVGLREDGWVDFGASARRADGKQDGGDALELTVRVMEEAKPEVMRQIARQLVSEARAAMEQAASNGEQPPAWIQTFMSPAGWEHYHALREEAGRPDQATLTITEPVPTGGVAGFHVSNAVPAVAALHQAQDTPEALAAEIGAEMGEPCPRCGCTLSYQSGPYVMCHKCYPRPLRLGRLSDDQWRRLLACFPRSVWRP